MLKLLSLELGVVGAVVLALTIADIPAIAVGITAATGLIGAIGYWVVKIITAIKEKQDVGLAKQEVLAANVTDVLAKQEIIAGKVDGTASAAVAKIDLLQQQVTMLLAAAAEKKETAALQMVKDTAAQQPKV